jgi:hypothetical protein
VKRRRNSKTYWLGALLVVLGAVQVYLPEVRESIPPDWYPLIFAGIGVAVMVLREFTRDAVGNPDGGRDV